MSSKIAVSYTHLVTNGKSGAIYGAAGSTLGTSLGAAAGLLFLILVMLMYNRILQKNIRRDRISQRESYGSILRVLVLTIVPVILSTAVYNISGIIDQGVFKYLMLDLQKAEKSTVEIYWGIYVGKYKLLTNVPIAVASALSASTICLLYTSSGISAIILKMVIRPMPMSPRSQTKV